MLFDFETKNAISSNIESNADGFHHHRDLPTKVSGDAGKNNFFIFEQIPRLSRFRSRSEPSMGVREPPENTEIKSGLLDYFFHLGFEGEIICGNLC